MEDFYFAKHDVHYSTNNAHQLFVLQKDLCFLRAVHYLSNDMSLFVFTRRAQMGDNRHSVCSVISKSSVFHVYFLSLMLPVRGCRSKI